MARWLSIALLTSVLTGLASDGRAQKLDAELDDPELSVLANTVWSMTLPERDFGGGCLQGFLAFKFQPSGYFIYNNRISGWWRLDTASGNIRMRTRDGLRFLLAMEGDTLRVPQNLPFLKRGNTFGKCGPNE